MDRIERTGSAPDHSQYKKSTKECQRIRRMIRKKEQEELLKRRLERKKKLKKQYEELWERKADAKVIQRRLYYVERMSWAKAGGVAESMAKSMHALEWFLNM